MALRARKVSGAFEKRATDPRICSPVHEPLSNRASPDSISQVVEADRPFAGCLLPLSQNESVRKHSYLHWQVHFHADQTHFHEKGFAGRLVFKQKQQVTRKCDREDD